MSARDHLLTWITRGRVEPGSQFPPEPQLASELGVSRATLREALRSLEDEGIVTRTRGAGTFLAHRPRLKNSLDMNFGVTDAIKAAGMRPGFEQGVTTIEQAGRPAAERLGLDPGEEVVVVERVRTADGRRVVFSRDVLPAKLIANHPGVIRGLGRGSIYELMERELGIVIHRGEASFAPVRANRAIASKLGVRAGTLLLYLQQVDYTDEGRAVLSSDEFHVADAFEFTIVRRGPGRRSR